MSSTRLMLHDVRGPLNDLIEKLCADNGDQWLKALNRMLRKENPWKVSRFRWDRFEDQGSELVEDVRMPDLRNGIETVPFLRNREKRISGKELARRAVELGANLGQHDAEWLEEHQELIPEEARKYDLMFPATKWKRAQSSHLEACFLTWEESQKIWYPFFDWLDGHSGFDDHTRLVRPHGVPLTT